MTNANAPKIHAPMCRVLVDNPDGEDKRLEVQTTNADMVLWDRTRVKHRWPKLEDAPFLWMTFVSWAGARRSGLIPPEMTYETWEAKVLDIDVDSDTEESEVEAFPPGVGAD